MLTQMVDLLVQQDPTLLAQRTVDARRYIMDQWDRTHRDPIDENALAVFLCDEAHSSLPEKQKIFAREKGAEVRDCYRNALFRLLLCGEMLRRGMVSGAEEYCRVFLPATVGALDRSVPHAAACDALCAAMAVRAGHTPHPSCRARCAGCVRQAVAPHGAKCAGAATGRF